MHTAVFAVVDAVVLRPLPYPEPDRLVAFASWETGHGAPRPDALSYPNFFDFRAGNRGFEHLVCYRDDQFAVSLKSGAIHVDGGIVSWDLFDALRVAPALGRGFLPEEEKPGAHVTVLGHELWPTQFGADPSVVGLTVPINGKPYTIVGIAPADFVFPENAPPVQLWTSLALAAGYNEYNEGSEFHPLNSPAGRSHPGRHRSSAEWRNHRRCSRANGCDRCIYSRPVSRGEDASQHLHPAGVGARYWRDRKTNADAFGRGFSGPADQERADLGCEGYGLANEDSRRGRKAATFCGDRPRRFVHRTTKLLGRKWFDEHWESKRRDFGKSAALGVAIQELQRHRHVLPAFPAPEVKPPSISRLST